MYTSNEKRTLKCFMEMRDQLVLTHISKMIALFKIHHSRGKYASKQQTANLIDR